MDIKTPFRVVRGTEEKIKSLPPSDGYVYFTTDTKKIYLDSNDNRLPMGGNSGIYYGEADFGEVDTDQDVFYFNIDEIEGNADQTKLPTIVPNADDLILNADGCFYRVEQITGENWNIKIKTKKLTIAGTGGPSSVISLLVTDEENNFAKHFTRDTKEAKIKFTVNQKRGPEDNEIVSVTYNIGNIDTIIKNEEYAMGHTFEFDLLPYVSRMSTANSTAVTVTILDAYGTRKSVIYYINIISISLTSTIKDNILMTTTGSYKYQCKPAGGSTLDRRQVVIEYYNQYNDFLKTETIDVLSSNTTIFYDLDFIQQANSRFGIGVYGVKVYYVGYIPDTSIKVSSNILEYKAVYYSQEPLLVSYLNTYSVEQFSTLALEYMVAADIKTDQEVKINLIITSSNEEAKTIERAIPYNTLKVWNIYFDTLGTYNLTIQIDETKQSITYEGIQVTPYENSGMPVIDPTGCALYLSALNRSNDEINKASWTFKKDGDTDLITTDFEGFAWGNTNGWISKVIDGHEDQVVDVLRLSSKAKATVNFEPFKKIEGNKDAMDTGLTIELDFMLSGITDFSKPLIYCLSYIDPTAEEKEIQVGFQVTGQESTFNTQNITATGASIRESDEESDQIYNTKIQGLTAKFIENERIHLTWVIEQRGENYPMIRTYLNGIRSGITQYDKSDQMAQNATNPAKIIFDSTYGVIDVYNIRIYQEPLSDINVLNNYIATLDTPSQRAIAYEDNILLQDNTIDFKTITNGTYKLSVPYITITGGEGLTKPKDDEPFAGEYYLNSDTECHLPVAKKDYRLIRQLEFVDQSGKHPNRTYTSTFVEKEDQGQTQEVLNGLVMYGQGTSSMEYPVKNLRIKWKMKDENGQKIKFTVNSDDCPVDLICCKADYMESSGSHNTGTANLIYELLKEGKMVTPAQQHYDSSVDYSITTTIRGYPILIFYRASENDDYAFVGKYNLNLDKATSEPFGFFPDPVNKPSNMDEAKFGWGEKDEGEIIETIHCYEFLNNADALTNFTMPEGTYGYLEGNTYHEAETYEQVCKSNYKKVDGVWQEITNEEGIHCPMWFKSYESRYPEGEEKDGSDVSIDSFLRLCSWINSTDTTGLTGEKYKNKINKFKEEAKYYLDIPFTTFYYVLTHLLLMIDSRAKNMMMATWDDTIWYPIFYDMDTMLGLNNYGYNKFSYDVEDTDANIYNGHKSVLWNNFREAFSQEIREMYNRLQKDSKLNYNDLLSFYSELQADAVNEAVYNVDSQYKYIRPFSEGYWNSVDSDNIIWVEEGSKDYLYASQGNRSMHRKWWLKNRLNYLNGKYLTEAFKNDKYVMRLYTPTKNDITYVEIGQIDQEEFNRYSAIYIREIKDNDDGTTTYEYKQAEEYNPEEFYFIENKDKLNATIDAVPPDNNFELTPLSNQYLSVAYGGSNGTTVGPIKGQANASVHITTEQKFNDTETYIYGGSNLKDLGDLSPQYLGAFKFPDTPTKLETLTLGNLNKNYYNPNFSSLSIGTSAPYLSELNITNCVGLSRQDLNLMHCPNLKTVLATGTGLTGISFAEHGVLEELRLPTSIRTLKLIDQPYLQNNKFTIGTYDFEQQKYNPNDYSKLLHICLNDVPNINTYQIVLALENSSAFQSYCFKNVNWEIQQDDEMNDKGIKVLTILENKSTYQEFAGTQPLTGTLTFPKDITDNFTADILLTLYNNYLEKYPELYFNFKDTGKINTVKIVDHKDQIKWESKIAHGNSTSKTFLSTYSLEEKIVEIKDTYQFSGKWHIVQQSDWDDYHNGIISKQELLNKTLPINDDGSKKPIGITVTSNIVIIPSYETTPNKYTVTFVNGNGDTRTQEEVLYGTQIKDIYPQDMFPYKPDEANFTLYQGYNFIGYGLSATDDTPLSETYPITSDINFYALFNKVSDLRKTTLHYEDYFEFINIVSPDNSGEECYQITPKYSRMFGKIVIPTSYKNKKVMVVGPFSEVRSNNAVSQQQITHIFFENDKNIYKIQNYCCKGIQTLQYFEFINNIQRIESYAFRDCNFQVNKYDGVLYLPSHLTFIGEQAFNSSFGKEHQSGDLNFFIPSSVTTMGKYAIAHTAYVKTIVYIGTQDNLSKLEVNQGNSNDPLISSNGDGSYDICEIYFYTDKYSAQSMINGTLIGILFDARNEAQNLTGNINVSYLGGQQ